MDMDHGEASGSGEGPASQAEQLILLKRAVQDAPTDYNAHLGLVAYLRKERPGSLDLLKAREE